MEDVSGHFVSFVGLCHLLDRNNSNEMTLQNCATLNKKKLSGTAATKNLLR